MIVPWTIGGLLNELTARGGHPAVISFGEDGVVTWGSEALAEKALSLARGLRENGVDKGSAVALWAPNSPVWIAAALGVLAAGGMLVPIDDLADAEQFEAALNSSGARLIFTTARHLEASGANDEPAMLSWTSGTIGSPKAFILTHLNIATNIEALQQNGCRRRARSRAAVAFVSTAASRASRPTRLRATKCGWVRAPPASARPRTASARYLGGSQSR